MCSYYYNMFGYIYLGVSINNFQLLRLNFDTIILKLIEIFYEQFQK